MKTGMKIIVSLMLVGVVTAQTTPDVDALFIQGKKTIEESVNAWDIQRMMGARGYFERLVNEPTYPWLAHYYVAYADMRMFGYHMSNGEKDKALAVVDDGLAHLEKSVALNPEFAEGYALLSALMGNKIGLKPLLGMTLGMKSGSMIAKAFQLAPKNPRVSFISGQSAYYTPSMFGGGKDKAREKLMIAIELFGTFEVEKEIFPDWGEDEAHAYLGMVQMDKNELSAAKASFEKALELNPNNNWVKFDLMKRVDEKIAEASK